MPARQTHAKILTSIRKYAGEYAKHQHDHVQIMFALLGRMELEINGHAAFADTSCGMVIPAGVSHSFLACRETRMFVIDLLTPHPVARVRRFAVTPACRQSVAESDSVLQLALTLQAPRITSRRGIDLARLNSLLKEALHESWSTARLAEQFYLSPQRFHARLLELTGLTPQAYIRNLRLDAAQSLISKGVLLDTAAQQIGYGSASALSFALKRERRLSARSLRNIAT